ncbi:putative serine protease K12H4.7 isoform X2 [Sminthopsis crassicaudata]|uniref:putative serine protease K12H4.7 isoform X2 n=1 Tax=Sminthopsis crassicaudata TaxID=9301 RepID=UPI003D687BB6
MVKELEPYVFSWSTDIMVKASQPGSLAAWLKVKHPEMFHSAVAYSAPIYAKANFSEYLEVVQKALFRHGNSECVNAVRNASQVLMYMLKYEKYHRNISRDFRLCEKVILDSEEKISYFLETLKSRISFLVQYNKERPLNQNQMNHNFGQITTVDITLDYFCQVMTTKSLGTPYERYAYFFIKNLKAYQFPCWNSSYENFLAFMRHSEWNREAAKGARQWLYQTCTEFGFFQTTDSKHQPFLGVPMSFYIDKCNKIFDLKFDINSVLESVKNTNKYYFKPLIKTGQRILFLNGDLDPWNALSINARMPRNLVGMTIKNSSHCEVMFKNPFSDPQNLKKARHFIFKTLLSWLSE